MDNTEIHYMTFDPNETLTKMLAAYHLAGGGPVHPGDEKEMLMQGVLIYMVMAAAEIDNALRMATLRYAVGDYLDLKGEDKDCYRIEAAKATASITITKNATGVSETIPAGSSLTEDGEVMYLTDEDITLDGTAGTVTATITAEETGTRGNGLASGAAMQFLLNYDGVASVVAASAATGGQDEEDDDTYRERIRTYGLSTVTTGPSEQYERIAKETSSDIIDAKAVHGDDLEVNIYLILKDGASSEQILAEVAAACSPKDARPLDDYVTVDEAEDVLYTLNMKYSGPDGTDLAAAVAAAVAKYQDWQDNTIGQVFNPDILKSYMYQAGCDLVVFGAGSNFDGGTVERTEIDNSQRCKGTITTAVIDE